ncbi:unnamed protein product, partial [Ectocarpus fasciculatus]
VLRGGRSKSTADVFCCHAPFLSRCADCSICMNTGRGVTEGRSRWWWLSLSTLASFIRLNICIHNTNWETPPLVVRPKCVGTPPRGQNAAVHCWACVYPSIPAAATPAAATITWVVSLGVVLYSAVSSNFFNLENFAERVRRQKN